MKKHLLSLLCLVCMAMQCLTASALEGNPQVTMTPKEITATTASLTFTPNADVKSYYCVSSTRARSSSSSTNGIL